MGIGSRAVGTEESNAALWMRDLVDVDAEWGWFIIPRLFSFPLVSIEAGLFSDILRDTRVPVEDVCLFEEIVEVLELDAVVELGA